MDIRPNFRTNPSKQVVASSSLVSRSRDQKCGQSSIGILLMSAETVELLRTTSLFGV